MTDADVIMPQLGETVSEGTVSRWLVEVGQAVAVDQPLLEVSTDKVDTEVLSPADGVLREILVDEGETVPVGTVLASLGGDPPKRGLRRTNPDRTEPSSTHATATSVVQPANQPETEHVSSSAERRHRDSPRTRRLARQHGVDLDGLTHRTGLHGRATEADVLAARSPQEPVPYHREGEVAGHEPHRPIPHVALRDPGHPPMRGRVERLSARRKVIAERMHRSLQEAAQLTTVIEVDLTHVVKAREELKEDFRSHYGSALSVLAFVAEAAVRALLDHPLLHAHLSLEEGTVTFPDSVDLGIAVDTEQGLVVPVIRRADDLTVGALARRIADLAAKARAGSATADDFAGGSFTVTNTGSRGALFDTPILNIPQSAILGLGSITRRPVALPGEEGDELIAIRSMAYLSLTYDHRLVDGADAARYLASVKRRLQTANRSWSDAVGARGPKP